MNIVIVCGNWNEDGGRPSKVMEEFVDGAVSTGHRVQVVNGGNYDALPVVQEKLLKGADGIVWMPNVPNDLPKLRDIKKMYPKSILVTSKANLLGDYATADIVAHGLALKANLIIRIDVLRDRRFRCTLLDPLGNSWMPESYDFRQVGVVVMEQIDRLRKITRVPTTLEEKPPTPFPEDRADVQRFLQIIKDLAETFHELVAPAEGIKRFMGNASFRCMRGFPSMRSHDGVVFVSRRNVDKRHIDADHFVWTRLDILSGNVYYRGEHKPSVDTPIQLALYRYFKRVNFMVHSHVYVEGAPYTERMVPCGGTEEIEEVIDTANKHRYQYNEGSFAINLKGHGSIVFAETPRDILKFKFVRRQVPELMYALDAITSEEVDDLLDEGDEDFIIHWNDGLEEVISGPDFDTAMFENGYTMEDYHRIDWCSPLIEDTEDDASVNTSGLYTS
jgi:ribulose-5-phosphate 4-epimerase/fuculose-1-phosphate aldolase